jgi:peptidoglycan L-alanyl-D-glutamate endopeptidase CwlK
VTVTAALVAPMFPGAPLRNIEANLPHVLQALSDAQLGDRSMLLMALGTIRAEASAFEPVSEGISRFNTSPAGQALVRQEPGAPLAPAHPFDLYDSRPDLGNRGAPDGERFRGRGFVQLTGRANYQQHGAAIGVDLVASPDLANDPVIAARLLASFLKAKEPRIRAALAAADLGTARRLVNGGSHGLEAFADAYRAGDRLIRS